MKVGRSVRKHHSLHLQLIESMEDGKVVVALGGGRRNFLTVENGGRRSVDDLVNRCFVVIFGSHIRNM